MSQGLTLLRENLEQAIATILEVDATLVQSELANESIEADIAVPLFRFAKEKQTAPDQLARQVAETLKDEAYEHVEALSGFVNITLTSRAIADCVSSLVSGGALGESTEGHGKTIVVDFIGPNLSKPYSVGHLRPAVQGAALIELYRALGYEVIGDSHLGDWGTPFGMWVVGYLKWGDETALERDGVYELGRLYVQFRKEAKEDPELMDEAKAWLKKLEAGDAQALEYKKRFTDISLEHLETILGRLKIVPDENLGESFYVENAMKLVNQLLEQGIALRNNDSSVIVDLSDVGIDVPILLEKSDGSVLYATTDIETIRYRIERWKPEKIIYSVGSEQQFHFKQVFALAKKLGYQSEFVHAWFGTVDELDEDGKRGKMSSRKSAALLENLLDTAETKAKEHIKNEIPEDDIKKIAVGAIKFSDFSASRQTNILFDWDKMFSLQGFSGPYIQYAAVRVRSILSKLNEHPDKLSTQLDYDWVKEKDILFTLARYPDVIKSAATEYEPHRVAQYAFDLAQSMNRYYEAVSIQNSEGTEREARVAILGLVSSTFEHSLKILGIEIPEKM